MLFLKDPYVTCYYEYMVRVILSYIQRFKELVWVLAIQTSSLLIIKVFNMIQSITDKLVELLLHVNWWVCIYSQLGF